MVKHNIIILGELLVWFLLVSCDICVQYLKNGC